MRLKTEIRIAAQVRRAEAAGAFATVVRRGDPDAGAIAVKLYLGPPGARVFYETRDAAGARVWAEPLGDVVDEAAVDKWLARETNVDPDLWILEIEDREGRAFLEDA